jgi:hypothetical protein
MGEFLNRLENYRILNNLLPGLLFIFACDTFGIYTFNDQSVAILAFVAYFLGMTFSRIGSLVLEKPLKLSGFVKFSSYDRYIIAEKADAKISLLMEEANTYRTIVATSLVVALAGLIKLLHTNDLIAMGTIIVVLVALIILIYLFAYRKQTKFVVKRIEFWNKNIGSNTPEQTVATDSAKQ